MSKELIIPKIVNKNFFMKGYCPLNTQHLKLNNNKAQKNLTYN